MRDNTQLFQNKPVPQAVLALALPTVVSQIITVIYNMADTLFIGQLNDPDQVAAATVSMSMFIFMTALANLFGIGGASKISKCLGMGDKEGARACASFCLLAATTVALLFGVVLFFARGWFLPLLGASGEVYQYACSYLFWTVTIGAVPTVLNETLAHLVLAEGYSKQAAFGVALGGILNIVLDPLFIFTFQLQIKGAAIATMLSNAIATTYFLVLITRKRNEMNVGFRGWKKLTPGIVSGVFLSGLPSFLSSFLASFSSSMLSRLTASYSSEAIAGAGIAKKIDLLAYAVAQGMTQGVLPLIGYNYACGNRKRMFSTIKTTLVYALSVSSVMMLILYFFAEPITHCFIKDTATVHYGRDFLKIICWICPATAINFMCLTVFQTTERPVQPIILTFLRKGAVDVPLMFLLEYILGFDGIAWAILVAEWVALVVALSMLLPYMHSLNMRVDNVVNTE